MASTNDITGDKIQSKIFSAQGRENFDAIFRKKQTMKKLVLASATWCGPCQGLKSRLQTENLLDRVELKDADVDITFFKDNNIKSVPRLLVMNGDVVDEFVIGVEEIYSRIKAAQ